MALFRKKRICLSVLSFFGIVFLVRHFSYSNIENNQHHNLHSNICCQRMEKECLACQMSLSVDEFCEIHGKSIHCSVCSTCEDDYNDRVENIDSQKAKRLEYCKEFPGRDNCSLDIMIAIVLYPGKGYAEFAWSVATKYNNINEKDVYIFPIDLTESAETKIRQVYGSKVNVASPSSEEVLNEKVLKTFKESRHNVLFLIKSDMIFMNSWRYFIEKNILQTDGCLSLYHPSFHHNTTDDCEKLHDNLCVNIPNGFEGYGVALTRNISNLILTKQTSSFEEIFDGKSSRFFYPQKSLAMHIGQNNQSYAHCGMNVDPHRFLRCELPEWIQSGIEFYSDRCTDAEEQFQFGLNIKDRFWSRPAVSFSLYGTSPRYTHLAMINAKRMSSIYPNWKMWIFYDDTVPKQVLRDLCEYNIRFINMTGSTIKNKMSWRFLVASEPVQMYAVRDIDSWILARGKAAVDEWVKSRRRFHVMRDHPFHSRHPINGGMWGGTHDAIPNMRELLMQNNLPNAYIKDMSFLRQVVWPIAKESVWAHDSHSAGLFGEDHPFPLDMEDPRFFVGSVN